MALVLTPAGGAVGRALRGILVTLVRQRSPIHTTSETPAHGNGPRTTPEPDPSRTRLVGRGPECEMMPDRPGPPGQWVPGHEGSGADIQPCSLGVVKVPLLIPLMASPGLAGSDENPHVSLISGGQGLGARSGEQRLMGAEWQVCRSSGSLSSHQGHRPVGLA